MWGFRNSFFYCKASLSFISLVGSFGVALNYDSLNVFFLSDFSKWPQLKIFKISTATKLGQTLNQASDGGTVTSCEGSDTAWYIKHTLSLQPVKIINTTLCPKMWGQFIFKLYATLKPWIREIRQNVKYHSYPSRLENGGHTCCVNVTETSGWRLTSNSTWLDQLWYQWLFISHNSC